MATNIIETFQNSLSRINKFHKEQVSCVRFMYLVHLLDNGTKNIPEKYWPWLYSREIPGKNVKFIDKLIMNYKEVKYPLFGDAPFAPLKNEEEIIVPKILEIDYIYEKKKYVRMYLENEPFLIAEDNTILKIRDILIKNEIIEPKIQMKIQNLNQLIYLSEISKREVNALDVIAFGVPIPTEIPRNPYIFNDEIKMNLYRSEQEKTCCKVKKVIQNYFNKSLIKSATAVDKYLQNTCLLNKINGNCFNVECSSSFSHIFHQICNNHCEKIFGLFTEITKENIDMIKTLSPIEKNTKIFQTSDDFFEVFIDQLKKVLEVKEVSQYDINVSLNAIKGLSLLTSIENIFIDSLNAIFTLLNSIHNDEKAMIYWGEGNVKNILDKSSYEYYNNIKFIKRKDHPLYGELYKEVNFYVELALFLLSLFNQNVFEINYIGEIEKKLNNMKEFINVKRLIHQFYLFIEHRNLYAFETFAGLAFILSKYLSFAGQYDLLTFEFANIVRMCKLIKEVKNKKIVDEDPNIVYLSDNENSVIKSLSYISADSNLVLNTPSGIPDIYYRNLKTTLIDIFHKN